MSIITAKRVLWGLVAVLALLLSVTTATAYTAGTCIAFYNLDNNRSNTTHTNNSINCSLGHALIYSGITTGQSPRAGADGQVFLHDGSNDGMESIANLDSPLGGEDRSFGGWFNATARADYDMFIGWGVDNSTTGVYSVMMPRTNNISFYGGGIYTCLHEAVALNEWKHYVLVINESATKTNLFIDGALVCSETHAQLATPGGQPLMFGMAHDGFLDQYNGQQDDVFVINGSLTDSDVAGIYANGTAWLIEGHELPAPATTVTIQANNSYNFTLLQDFNVSVGNTTHEIKYRTNNGSVILTDIAGTYWLNFTEVDFFDYSVSQTFSFGDTIMEEMFQTHLTCLATEYVSNLTINVSNCTAGLAFNSTDNASVTLKLNNGTYSVNWSAPGYYSENQTQTLAVRSHTVLSQEMGTALIIFAPRTYLNQSPISGFTVYLESLNWSWNETRASIGNYVNWTYLINGTYSVRINSSGYFNHTGTLTVTNSSASYVPDMWTSEIRVYARDTLTSSILTDFSVLDQFGNLWNSSGNVTTMYLDVGPWNFTILREGFENQSWLNTTTALSNYSVLRDLAPLINYSLIDEATLADFDVATMDECYIDIFCSNQTLHGDFKTTNASNLYLGVGCDYYLVKVTVTYNDSSYFRTLVPADDERNVSFYMVDISTDTVVQRILNLIDLTGDYTQGEIRVTRFLDGATRDIVRQPFDIEDAVTMYLMRDELYVLSVFDNDGSERSLGNLIADAAGEQTVTFPSIDFWPTGYVGDDVSWAYTFNTSASILRVQYEDSSNLTTWLRFTVYNSTWGQLFQTSSNLSDVTITYNGAAENVTYISLFEVVHPMFDPINETKVWRDRGGGFAEISGFDADNLDEALNWLSWIICTAVILLFSAAHAPVGGILAILLATYLRIEGWLDISGLWLGIGWIIAVLSFVQRRIKKK